MPARVENLMAPNGVEQSPPSAPFGTPPWKRRARERNLALGVKGGVPNGADGGDGPAPFGAITFSSLTGIPKSRLRRLLRFR